MVKTNLSKNLHRYIKIFGAIFFFISLVSCQVKLVPQYSADLENQIVNGAKMTNKLYLEMIDAPADKKNYDLYSAKYLDIESEINSILLKNEVREKAGDIVASVKILRDKFVKYKQDHKTRTTLSDPELMIYNEDMKALWAPVLVEERALSTVKQ